MALNIANSYFMGTLEALDHASLPTYMKSLQVIKIYIAHNITHALVDPRDGKDAACWEHLARFYIVLLGVKSAGLLQRREISPSSSFRHAISGALGVNILPGSIVYLLRTM